MERRKYIAELVERTGLQIDEDDPIFALVLLNRLVLQDQKTELEALVGKLVQLAQKVPDAALEQFGEKATPVLNKALGQLRTEANTLKDDLGNQAERAVGKTITDVVTKADEAVQKVTWVAGNVKSSVYTAAFGGGLIGGGIVAFVSWLLR